MYNIELDWDIEHFYYLAYSYVNNDCGLVVVIKF